MVFFFCLWLPLLISIIAPASAQEIDAATFCQQNYKTNKDYYADPSDCHYFYQCTYFNESTIYGIRQACTNGTYWSDRLIQCLPEGQTPCSDFCTGDAVATAGCYGSGSDQCSTYYRCANSVSYRFCCAPGTSFTVATCSCEWDSTCKAVCGQPPTVTTTLTPPVSNDTMCSDSYGNLLQIVEDRPDQYINIDLRFPEMPRRTLFDCAPGTWFNVSTCDCSIFAGNSSSSNSSSGSSTTTSTTPPSNPNQCILFLPFESDTLDHSLSVFDTQIVEGNITIVKTIAAVGAGSANFSLGALLEISGLKNFDFQSSGTWCLFYSTPSGTGTLISNGQSGNATFSLSALAGGQVSASFSLVAPIGTLSLQSPVAGVTGFQQVCVTLGNGTANLYVNNALRGSQEVQGSVANTYEPYWIGGSDFAGYIDDVLICRDGLTTEEVDAHYRGDLSYLVKEGLIPEQVLLLAKAREH